MYSDLKIPEARFLNAGGAQFVQPPGTKLQPGNVAYDHDVHHGKLLCPHCDAKVHFNRGSDVIAGGFGGQRPHFKTNPGSTHSDDCLFPLMLDEKDVAYNDSLGYRLHINLYSFVEKFNRNSHGIYSRAPGGRIELHDESLRPLRPVSIKSAQDLITLLAKGNFERIRNSVSIFNNKDLDWKDFMIRYSRGKNQAAYIGLVERLNSESNPYNKPARAFEIRLRKGASPDLFGGTPVAESEHIKLPPDEHGRKQTIVPRVFLHRQGDKDATWSMQGADSYLVLGVPSLKKVETKNEVVYNLNIAVYDPKQVSVFHLDSVVEAARRRVPDGRKLAP